MPYLPRKRCRKFVFRSRPELFPVMRPLLVNRRTNRNLAGLSGGPELGALPSWLTNAIEGALKGTSVQIGTSAGTKTFDLSDPKQVQQVLALFQSGKTSGVNVKFSGPGSTPGQNTGIFAGANPLLLGAGLLLALKLLL